MALGPEEVKRFTAEGFRIISQYPEIAKAAQIGSSVYLPNPEDVDFILLIRTNVADKLDEDQSAVAFVSKICVDDGWEFCGKYDDVKNGWIAMEKGPLNFIITGTEAKFNAYHTAMEICRGLNLIKKSDRRLVCRILRDGMTVEQALTHAMDKGEILDTRPAHPMDDIPL